MLEEVFHIIFFNEYLNSANLPSIADILHHGKIYYIPTRCRRSRGKIDTTGVGGVGVGGIAAGDWQVPSA
jgi:hypothetical protein